MGKSNVVVHKTHVRLRIHETIKHGIKIQFRCGLWEMVAPVVVGGGRQDRHERQAGPQQDPATDIQETTKRANIISFHLILSHFHILFTWLLCAPPRPSARTRRSCCWCAAPRPRRAPPRPSSRRRTCRSSSTRPSAPRTRPSSASGYEYYSSIAQRSGAVYRIAWQVTRVAGMERLEMCCKRCNTRS